MNRERKILLISSFIILYMVAAIVWWSVLLHRKNLELYEIKLSNTANVKKQAKIEASYGSQTKMIWGESSVFLITLFLCSWLIYRAFKREIEVNRTQKNFLLSVTHELKSPIASLLLSVDTLRKRKLNQETQNKLLANAKDDTKRLESLVSNILLSTKLDGQYNFNFEKIDLLVLLEHHVRKAKDRFPTAKINIQNNLKAQTFVSLDQESIISVINNLIENGIKYSVDPAQIVCSLSYANQLIMLEVADQGKGITATEKVKVKEMFYREGNEETRKTTGTGLGLYIVDQIVKGHQGTMKIRDNKPNGTIISIALPVNKISDADTAA